MIFEKSIHWYMYKYLGNIIVNIFCSSIANLICTPSDWEMYPWVYMYPSLGTPVLENQLAARFEKLPANSEKNLLDLAAKQLKWQHWA